MYDATEAASILASINAPTIRECIEERTSRALAAKRNAHERGIAIGRDSAPTPQRARCLRKPRDPDRDAAAIQAIVGESKGLRQSFPSLIPDRPYCSDELAEGLQIRAKPVALRRRHIQLNGPSSYQWMVHDIDRADAYFAHDNANLPPPNFIAINSENGRAHSAYLLAAPVACHSASRLAPLRFYAACERGVARRLGSDRFYTGLIAKNPLHHHWKVEWRREEPFQLYELEKSLSERDMRPYADIERTAGTGRNVVVFDDTRRVAYREIREFARDAGFEAWHSRCLQIAAASNQQFRRPMNFSEVRGIAKSVAAWVWKRFSPEQFSARQSYSGKKGMASRWKGHTPLHQLKPWESMGISRSTFFRHKAEGKF